MARTKQRDRGWRDWYQLNRWRKIRLHQLRLEPLCAMHLAKGEVVAATIVDHVTPHRGDWNQFWFGQLQSLCENCHNSLKHTQELRQQADYLPDVGIDGLPVDPRHPFNQPNGRRAGGSEGSLNLQSDTDHPLKAGGA